MLLLIENNMSLYEDKFELMVHKYNPNNDLIHLPHTIEAFTYNVFSTGATLYPVDDSLRDLGIIVSPDLSWSPHISKIVEKGRSVASWVLSVFRTRDKETMLTLYKSIVRSQVENCCPLWHPHKICDIQQLEAIQRTFTNKIHGIQHLTYWERLKFLKLMSLQRRRERYIILQMWKLLHGLSPNDINVKFTNSSRRGITAHVPTLSKNAKTRHQSLYDNSFAVIGPRLWNTLPSSITTIDNQKRFKDRLTAFLLTFPDTPPTKGYITTNNNSLLEWSQNKAEAQQSRRLEMMTC